MLHCRTISLLLLLFSYKSLCFKSVSLLIRGGGDSSSLSIDHEGSDMQIGTATASIRPPHPMQHFSKENSPMEGSEDDEMWRSFESLLSVFQNTSIAKSPRVIAIIDWIQPNLGGVLHIDGDSSAFYPRRWKRSRGLPLLHTMALLCDGIILRLKNNETAAAASSGPSSIVALIDGLIQKSKVTKSRGSLFLMLGDSNCDPDLMVALRSLDLGGVSEKDIHSLDVVSEHDASIVKQRLADWIRDIDEGSFGVDKETLFPLIERVYGKLGGQEDALLSDGILLNDSITSLPRGGSDEQTNNPFAPAIARSKQEMVLAALEDLQDRQHENALDETAIPMQFGKHAKKIIEQLKRVEHNHRPELQERLKCLHDEHLQTLRDYFGRLYETMLDRSNGTPTAISSLQEKMLQSFRRAAEDSIPPNAPKELDLNYAGALGGLCQDMKDVAYLRRDLADELEVHEDQDSPSKRKWIPPKWLKPLAARAFMLGVNYIQGWLALHGLRQAALERERNMPKIPLF